MSRTPVENYIIMVVFLFGINHLQAQAPLPAQDSSLLQPAVALSTTGLPDQPPALPLTMPPSLIKATQKVLPIKPTSDFDQRFYYMQNRWANVWGYRVGILVHDKYKLGIGGYYMNESVNEPEDVANLAISRTSALEEHCQQLYLGTIYYEPYLIRRNLWESSVVFEAGYGRSVNLLEDPNTKIIASKENKAFMPVGIGLSFNFKMPPLFGFRPIRWLGINAMTGYRKVLFQDGDTLNYDGAYWSVSGAIFLDRIIEDMHYWKGKKASRRQGVVSEAK